ncbi:MAG: single-stranded DNA-binding protein, partial [Bacilli bacterium]|nr:single-stranded DNA-binding protein [Bacilli bacterium]
MMNRICLVGRLTRDPELRRTNSEVAVCSFTLAVDDRVKDAQGNKTTTFIGVTVFNNQADNCAKFLRKGSLAGVDGRIRQRTFER